MYFQRYEKYQFLNADRIINDSEVLKKEKMCVQTIILRQSNRMDMFSSALARQISKIRFLHWFLCRFWILESQLLYFFSYEVTEALHSLRLAYWQGTNLFCFYLKNYMNEGFKRNKSIKSHFLQQFQGLLFLHVNWKNYFVSIYKVQV